jgi:hypothetical protein
VIIFQPTFQLLSERKTIPQLGQNEHKIVFAVALQLKTNVVLDANDFKVLVKVQNSKANVKVIALEEPQEPRVGRLGDGIAHRRCRCLSRMLLLSQLRLSLTVSGRLFLCENRRRRRPLARPSIGTRGVHFTFVGERLPCPHFVVLAAISLSILLLLNHLSGSYSSSLISGSKIFLKRVLSSINQVFSIIFLDGVRPNF